MGISIGELFMELGFDVDDAKLKSFDQKIRGAADGVAKLAGISALTVGGLAYFGAKIADNALKVQNFADANHYAVDSVLRYQAVLRQTTGAGADEALASYKRLNDYLVGLAGGAGGPTSQLGVRTFSGMTPDQLLNAVADALPAIEATHRYTPSQINTFLQQIGFSENAGAYLHLSKAERAALAGSAISGDDNARNAKLELQLRTLDQEWDKFVNHVIGTLAGPATKILVDLNKGEYHQAVRDIGKNYSPVSTFFDWSKGVWQGGAQGVADWIDKHYLTDKGTGVGGLTRGIRNNNPGNIKYGPFARAHGAEGHDSEGFAMFPTGGSGIAAIAALLQVYGHDHLDTITRIIEKYTKGDSPATQAAYEASLARRLGVGVNDHLNLSDPKVLGSLVNGIISQENKGRNPYGNINMYINSSAPAKDVADHVTNNLQRQLDSAMAVTDRGPVQ